MLSILTEWLDSCPTPHPTALIGALIALYGLNQLLTYTDERRCRRRKPQHARDDWRDS